MNKSIPEITAEERWPELYKEAQRIADSACVQINITARVIKSDAPYKAQGILEMVIKILELRV